MLNSPCKDCPDRHYLCHSECEKYLEFKKQNDALREKRMKQNQLDYDCYGTYYCFKKQKRRRPYADNRYGR